LIRQADEVSRYGVLGGRDSMAAADLPMANSDSAWRCSPERAGRQMADPNSLEVLRPDDLLSLTFEFTNLVISTGPGQPPQLVRQQVGQPALITVDLGPQHIAEWQLHEAQPDDLAPAPVPSAMADPSRLVFSVPDSIASIPLTLRGLLDWTRFGLVVPNNALPEPTGPLGPLPPTVAQPQSATAIELPFGLLLSPDHTAGWNHAIDQPVTRDGRTELWHTRLGVLSGGVVDESRFPAIRAVFPVHQSVDFAELFPSHPLVTIPNPQQREGIAHQTSDFTSPPIGPLSATHLFLSRLGAWTDLSGSWDNAPIANWKQIVCMGRDQYARLEQRGYLYPFFFQASTVQIVERKFRPGPTGEMLAYLCSKLFLHVPDQERQYGNRDLPFVRARVKGLLVEVENDPSAQVFIPTVAGAPVAFSVTGIDWHGQDVHFAAPMVVTTDAGLNDPAGLARQYADISNADLQNQPVAFTPPKPVPPGADAVDQGQADSVLQTLSMVFKVSDVSARAPAVDSAQVRIPAAERLAASTGSVPTIRYLPDYVRTGDLSVTRDLFATIESGLNVKFPANKVGGFAAPAMTLSGLSASRGAVTNATALLTNQFNELVAGLDGDMLGIFKLKDIIGPASSAAELPVLKTVTDLSTVTTSFNWTPSVKGLKAPLGTMGSAPATLTLSGSYVTGRDTVPQTHLSGTFANFTLTFPNVVELDFRSIAFSIQTGAPTKFTVEVADFQFKGDLRFVAALQDKLPFRNADQPFTVIVLPDGITVGVTASLPTIALPPFTFANIALSSFVTLYFFGGKPIETTFALSSRDNPFLVSCSPFGGGGHFALAARSDGGVSIEASIEFGAVIGFDVVVVAGFAEVAVGIYFSKDGTDVVLSGYLRIHGSLMVLEIQLSVDVTVGLKFISPDTIRVEAQITLMVSVCGFSKSVTIPYQKTFVTGHPSSQPAIAASDAGDRAFHRGFADAMSRSDWQDYCTAFA
jgi:hypothetical protein